MKNEQRFSFTIDSFIDVLIIIHPHNSYNVKFINKIIISQIIFPEFLRYISDLPNLINSLSKCTKIIKTQPATNLLIEINCNH